MPGHRLQFYYYDACPFCRYVQEAIERLKVKVEYCNILQDQTHLEKLIQDTGRKTVPCLYIDGSPMHESEDIVSWLKQNHETLEKVDH